MMRKGRPPEIPAETIIAIREGIAQGRSFRELSRQFGVSREHIRTLKHGGRADATIPSAVASLRASSDEGDQQVAALAELVGEASVAAGVSTLEDTADADATTDLRGRVAQFTRQQVERLLSSGAEVPPSITLKFVEFVSKEARLAAGQATENVAHAVAHTVAGAEPSTDYSLLTQRERNIMHALILKALGKPPDLISDEVAGYLNA
jgi:hypothetical protein